jgi:hypothetical protein
VVRSMNINALVVSTAAAGTGLRFGQGWSHFAALGWVGAKSVEPGTVSAKWGGSSASGRSFTQRGAAAAAHNGACCCYCCRGFGVLAGGWRSGALNRAISIWRLVSVSAS